MTRQEMDMYGKLLSSCADGSMAEIEDLESFADHIANYGFRTKFEYDIVKFALKNWVGNCPKTKINTIRQQLKCAVEHYEMQYDIKRQKRDLSDIEIYEY